MSNQNETRYTIRLQGDAEDVKKAVKVTETAMDGMAANVTKNTTVINSALGVTTAQLEFLAKTAKEAKALQAELSGAFAAKNLVKFDAEGNRSSPLLSVGVTDEAEKKRAIIAREEAKAAQLAAKAEAAAKAEMRRQQIAAEREEARSAQIAARAGIQARIAALREVAIAEREATRQQAAEQHRRNEIFTSGLKEAQKKHQAAIALEKEIAKNGSDSITAIKLRQAEKERNIQTSLLNELAAIRTKFTAGEINWIQQAAQRNAALNSSEAAILKLNAATNARIVAVNALAAAEKAANDKRIASEAAVAASFERARNAPIKRDNAFTGVAGMSQQLGVVKAKVEEVVVAHKSWVLRIVEAIGLYKLVSTGIHLVQQALLSIPRAGIALEAISASLTGATGSAAGAAKQIAFLNYEAERTGISLNTLRQSYSTFASSALLAGESLETVDKIFANVNTAATTLHLSLDQTNSVFLAFSQSFNKGKLQAEELVKQMAQVLPGVVNQAAKAIGLTAAELTKAMKAGTVEAHGTLLKLSEQLVKTFGGEAFAKAAHGMNSEIGRVQTAWTHLAENVYKASSEMLIDILRFTSGSVQGFSDFANNTTAVKKTFNELVYTVGGAITTFALARGAMALWAAAVAKAAAGTVGLSAAVSGLGVVLQRNLFGAVLLSLGAYIGKVIEAKNQTADLRREAREFAQEKEAQKSSEKSFTYSIENNEEVKRLRERAAQAREDLTAGYKNSAKGHPWYSMSAVTVSQSELAELEKTDKLMLQKLAAARENAKEELKKTKQQTQEQFRPKVDNSDLLAKIEAEVSSVKAGKIVGAAEKKRYELRKEFAAFQAQAKGEIITEEGRKSVIEAQKALADLELIVKEASTKAGAGGSKNAGDTAANEAKTAIKAKYKDISNSIADARSDIEFELTKLDGEFTRHETSISDYYSKKKNLQAEDLRLQREAVDAELRLAFQQKDVVKIADLNKQKNAIDREAKLESISLTNEQTASMLSYKDALASVKAERDAFAGDNTASTLAAWDAAHKETILSLEAERKVKGDTADLALESLKIAREGVRIQAELNKSLLEESHIRENMAIQELRVKTDMDSGAITEFEADYKRTEIRRKALNELEVNLTKREKMAAGGGANEEQLLSVRRSREELKAFGGEVNIIGKRFSTLFTENFANGFSSFVSGAASARDAFQNFSQGVVKGIADIVAQQAATAILGMFVKGIGLMTGSAGTVTPLQISGGPGWFATPNAKGNVFADSNIVPFARGGIPDIGSSMQKFRMGNGKIGSLRESGPEAILPLKRDTYGNLGVQVVSDGSSKSQINSGGNVYSIHVNVEHTGKESPDQLGTKVAESIIRSIARQEITAAARPGNQLNRSTKFG